jgi:hypothetical protein
MLLRGLHLDLNKIQSTIIELPFYIKRLAWKSLPFAVIDWSGMGMVFLFNIEGHHSLSVFQQTIGVSF